MSIKDFTILSELGKGAYSSVYKVQRIADKQFYALKKVKLLNLSEKQLQNALNQVRILASIHHSNIVTYKDTFLQGKNLCIVMEYMDKGDLYQAITEKKKKRDVYFEEKQVWNVLIQSARALKKLHSLKILHRDMKSANIFLNKNGEAKIGDLNVSKIAKEGLLYTQTGTPYYASPEVWKQKPYDSKSDIWSLGVVIYEMAALSVPFQAEDMQGLATNIIKGKYDPLPSIYSQDLCKVIYLMLEQNPTKRPSAQKLCRSSLLKNKARQIGLQQSIEQGNDDLLSTIRIPRKFQHLTDRFPNPNYEAKNRQLSRSVSQKRKTNQRKSSNYQSMSKANFPKIDKLLKYHQQKILDQRKRSIHERSSLVVYNGLNGIGNIQNQEAYSRQKVKKPSMNRKQMLRKDLKRIQEGKHEVNSSNRYY